MHLHHFDEGNACVNWVGYYIINMSIGYCTNEINEIKVVTTRPTWVLQNNKMI
jgi:hypothetical protein